MFVKRKVFHVDGKTIVTAKVFTSPIRETNNNQLIINKLNDLKL